MSLTCHAVIWQVHTFSSIKVTCAGWKHAVQLCSIFLQRFRWLNEYFTGRTQEPQTTLRVTAAGSGAFGPRPQRENQAGFAAAAGPDTGDRCGCAGSSWTEPARKQKPVSGQVEKAEGALQDVFTGVRLRCWPVGGASQDKSSTVYLYSSSKT